MRLLNSRSFVLHFVLGFFLKKINMVDKNFVAKCSDLTLQYMSRKLGKWPRRR